MKKFRRYQIASSWVLTDEIPEGFFDWTAVHQDKYLETRANLEYDNYPGNALWDKIEELESLIKYVIKEEKYGS